MLGGWVNPHREQQTIPQGHTSIPGATRLYTHSHELPALTALAQHISHSHSGIDEKRPTEKFVTLKRCREMILSWSVPRVMTVFTPTHDDLGGGDDDFDY